MAVALTPAGVLNLSVTDSVAASMLHPELASPPVATILTWAVPVELASPAVSCKAEVTLSAMSSLMLSASATAGRASIIANAIKRSVSLLLVVVVRIFVSPLLVIFPADLLSIPAHFSLEA
jgi:hypothetical protein